MGCDFGKRSTTLQDHVRMTCLPVGLQILSMQFGTAFWPIPTVTAMGGSVASNLGDPTAAAWYVTSFVLAVCIAFMTCGANSDLFGRRNFILMGNILALVSRSPGESCFSDDRPLYPGREHCCRKCENSKHGHHWYGYHWIRFWQLSACGICIGRHLVISLGIRKMLIVYSQS